MEATTGRPGVSAVLFRVGWLAVLLGLFMELLLVIFAWLHGGFQDARPFVADAAQKVSWAMVVCVGLAVARTVSKGQELVVGLAGLLVAPAAFTIARVVHRTATQALATTAVVVAISPLVLAGVKGLEYAVLGIAIIWISRQPWGGLGAHIAAGAIAGVVFGGTILALTMAVAQQPPSVAALYGWGVNELVFPIGCAVVLFVTDVLGEQRAG
jgi:hypothetical protein